MKVRVYSDGARLAGAGDTAAVGDGSGDLQQGGSASDVGAVSPPLDGGEVTLDIGGWPGGAQSLQVTTTQATTGDFLCVGQKVKFDLSAMTLWDWLHPAGGATPTVLQLQKLTATVAITALDGDTAISTQEAETATFSGSEIYDVRMGTSAVVLPPKTDTLRFALKLTDTSSQESIDFAQDQIAPRAVFGGALPHKNLLFDSTPAFRQRVIEGGGPVAGASVLFGYSDWRVDTLVDASMIDRQIGTRVSGGRMGLVTVPLYGELVHEVTYGVSFGEGQGWRHEVPLSPNTASLLLGPYRTCFESHIDIPANATCLSIYVHVRSTLVVSYNADPTAVRWYNDGDRLLRADRYDNPGGQPFVNYDFPVET